MKYTFSTLLCVVMMFAAGSAARTVYEEGAIAPTSTLLAKITINERFRFGQVVTKDYTYTTPVATTLIGYIKITDNKNLQGSSVTKTAGGVGTPSVSFTFTSKRGFGMKFTIEIWSQ